MNILSGQRKTKKTLEIEVNEILTYTAQSTGKKKHLSVFWKHLYPSLRQHDNRVLAGEKHGFLNPRSASISYGANN